MKLANEDEKPEDLYSSLIEDFRIAINLHVQNNPLDLNLQKQVIDRNFIKRPVMTVPYSVTIHGITHQIGVPLFPQRPPRGGSIVNAGYRGAPISQANKVELNKEKKRIFYFNSIDGGEIEINYPQIFSLSHILFNIIITKFPSLKLLFQYYHNIVSLLVKYDLPVKWETPNGITRCQNYNTQVDETIKFKIERRSRSVVLRSPSIPKSINRNKSKLAIVPNIIHSLDSTHLNYIVKEFINLDLPIVTVHDCFVIHPNS